MYLGPGKKHRRWYYQTYDAWGRRTPAKSTGLENKADAYAWCMDRHNRGVLGNPPDDPTLREWVESRHWWDWARCEYVKGKLLRSEAGKPAITRAYADRSKTKVDTHILPYLGTVRLSKLTPQILERWMFDLLATGLAPKTVNNIAAVLRTMVREAWRLEMIERNPWDRVRPLANNSKPRGILTVAEARLVLDPVTAGKVWEDHVFYVANLLAAFTGLRQGEVLAMDKDHVFDDHLSIEYSWDRQYGRKTTKTKESRVVPLPPMVAAQMAPLMDHNGFVFSKVHGLHPVRRDDVTQALYDALDAVEIHDYKTRRIAYHSWRHFANTYFRSQSVPDAKVMHVTGHKTMEMVDRYTHFRAEDFTEVIAAQNRLL